MKLREFKRTFDQANNAAEKMPDQPDRKSAIKRDPVAYMSNANHRFPTR